MRFAPGLIRFLVALALVTSATPTLAQSSIVLQPVITSVPTPPARNLVGLVNAGDGSGRLFLVVQQGEILALNGSTVQSPAYLDIRTDVLCCGERGLLGVAFHPQFETNGFFWVYYTDLTGANVLARFQASPPSSGVVNPATRRILFTDTQPGPNHNGGQLAFGPDGFLYLSKGDGANSDNGQSLSTRLGKILRIQPSLGASAPFYTVPASNPFVGTPGAAPEIWAYGLRNTWRFSFDRLTGDMFPADVGEGTREEVNFQPADVGGRNYGWPKMEGSLCVNPPTNCNPTGALVEPILEYDQSAGDCAVTGGFRYRGDDFPSLAGIYFYADFCTGRIWGATESGGSWTTQQLLDTNLGISSFGEDENGEVYVVDRAGGVYRIAAAGGSPDLRIEGLGLSSGSVAPGGQVTVSYNVANRGSTTVSQVYTDRIYLSANSALGGDVTLGTSHGHTADLAPNATHAHSQAVTIPAGTAPGSYFILVQADALGAVAEGNEGNNVAGIIVNVTATSGEIIVDNAPLGVTDAARTFTGTWCLSAGPSPFGPDSLYSCGGGAETYRWIPTVPATGAFNVYVRWTQHANRSTAVPIAVTHAGGTTTRTFNEQTGGGVWVLHGRYTFNGGTSGFVQVNDSAGQAAADAIRLVPATTASEIIVDNAPLGVTDAARTFTGTWCLSVGPSPFGPDSLYSCGGGAETYRWIPTVPATGAFNVYVRWTQHANRSTAVPIAVTHAAGTTTRSFNEQTGGGVWVLHGRYTFNGGTGGFVQVNDSAGQAAADAVRLVPASGP